ncbi:MAG: NOP5/NOP56 family protein [archaeon]
MGGKKVAAVTALGVFSADDLSLISPLQKGREIEILEMSDSDKGAFFNVQVAESGFDILAAAEKNGVSREAALAALRNVAIEITGARMRKRVGLDYLLINEINTLDELNVVLNALSTRLRELWGLYYPELDSPDNEVFARKVSEGIERPLESIGAEIPAEELGKISSFARAILALYQERKEIEKNIEGLAAKIAPRLAGACGGILCARLIAKAGSLERLAYMPSSTVQVLGAEKALFKHLTRGVPCPKHGLIFQYPEIQSAPKEKRGKIARHLAGKLAIAARIDHFSGPGNQNK